MLSGSAIVLEQSGGGSGTFRDRKGGNDTGT